MAAPNPLCTAEGNKEQGLHVITVSELTELRLPQFVSDTAKCMAHAGDSASAVQGLQWAGRAQQLGEHFGDLKTKLDASSAEEVNTFDVRTSFSTPSTAPYVLCCHSIVSPD